MEVVFIDSKIQLQGVDENVMAFGFFDGVHLGHQELLKTTSEYAKQHNMKSAALTFSPHPDEVIKGMENRKYITLLEEKIEKILQCGIDTVYVMKFDLPFASLDPIDFIENYIVNLNVKHVVVGFDFTFGFKAKGDVSLLQDYADNTGKYTLSVIPKKMVNQTKIGSTETKQLVQNGDVDQVVSFLGSNYQVKSQIKHRYGNVYVAHINNKYILPEYGQYRISIIQHNQVIDGILSIDDVIEIYINDHQYALKLDEKCSITFLNKVKVGNVAYA